MMQIGCALPAKTFMPEYSAAEEKAQSALQTLLYGYETAVRLGYDYIEASVGAIHDLTSDELSALEQRVKSGTFCLRACNSFVPPTLPICTADAMQIESFVRDTMQKLDRLRVRTVVFGSGKARQAPEGMSEADAREKMLRFLRVCSRAGAVYGITTAIEPLNHTETNQINTVRDAVFLADAIGADNIRVLPDLFHMAMEGEAPSVLLLYRDRIVHLHASEAPGRVWPGKYGGDYLRFCGQALREADYEPDITVECVFGDFETEAASSMQFMKECFVCSQ